MNNKGFTLVELLATIVVLSAVLGIATFSITSAITKSKEKSEKIFVGNLATAVQGYVSVQGRTLGKIETAEDRNPSFKKCRNSDSSSCVTVKLYELTPINLQTITTGDYKTIDAEKIVNPKNEKNCLNGKNPTIRVFRDTDLVYYYYMDLSGTITSCEISEENAISSNLSKNACETIGGNYNEGLCKL